MKLITAVLQPSALAPVKAALAEAGITGMTVYEAKGHGAQAGKVEVYRSQKILVEFLPKISIEVIVTDATLDAALTAISEGAHTGQIGDGKIWVSEVSRVIRVRTGETDEDAV
ncbi:P-II family nitrogen regulator [Brevibacterium oceani]|uniref:P-II family nitrogen regulator n=1 Tax=Brevibacterium oceani TaxID=358099 RepID=UPI0015E7BD71|nr:P-II family nitrogen regulator [Brevibacterium oceani]